MDISSVLRCFSGFSLLRYKYHSKSTFTFCLFGKMNEVFHFFFCDKLKNIIIYLVSYYMYFRLF